MPEIIDYHVKRVKEYHHSKFDLYLRTDIINLLTTIRCNPSSRGKQFLLSPMRHTCRFAKEAVSIETSFGLQFPPSAFEVIYPRLLPARSATLCLSVMCYNHPAGARIGARMSHRLAFWERNRRNLRQALVRRPRMPILIPGCDFRSCMLMNTRSSTNLIS